MRAIYSVDTLLSFVLKYQVGQYNRLTKASRMVAESLKYTLVLMEPKDPTV